MKKKYSSPVVILAEVRPFAFILGSTTGTYNPNSLKNEGTEDMSRQSNWDVDDEY